MKKKIIIIVIGSILYAILKSITTKNNHIIDLLFPLIISLPIAFIIELFRSFVKRKFEKERLINTIYNIWIPIMILLMISLSVDFEFSNL